MTYVDKSLAPLQMYKNFSDLSVKLMHTEICFTIESNNFKKLQKELYFVQSSMISTKQVCFLTTGKQISFWHYGIMAV